MTQGMGPTFRTKCLATSGKLLRIMEFSLNQSGRGALATIGKNFLSVNSLDGVPTAGVSFEKSKGRV